MKNKNLLLKGLTCLLLIPCFIIPFVSLFAGIGITGSITTNLGGYGLFGDYSTLEVALTLRNAHIVPFWMTLTSIFVVILAILALLYIIMFIMELLGIKCKALPKYIKLVSILILVCSILTLISAIIAICVNRVTIETAKSTAKLIFAIGSWLLISPILAGIVGILPKYKKAKSKKK